MVFDSLARFGKEKKIKEPEEPIIDVHQILASVIKDRKSVRKYQDKDVPHDLLCQVLESARHAPSCGNYQPWEFVVVRNKALKNDIAEACYNQNWMREAPVFIIACMNCRLAGAVYGERGLRLYGIQAVAAAIQNILLTAHSLGLGTCWVGAFSEIIVSKLLQCPAYVRPAAVITIGFPADDAPHAKKQEIKEFVHHEAFGDTHQIMEVDKEKKPTYIKFQ